MECCIPLRLVRIHGSVGTLSHVVLRSTIYTRAFHVIRGYVIGTIRQCPQHRLGPGVFGISFYSSHRTQESRWAEIGLGHIGRSEEQTSELQSLMRISYAVFGLKKKNNNDKQKQYIQTNEHLQNYQKNEY